MRLSALAAILLLVVSQSAHAAKFTKLQQLNNPALEQLATAVGSAQAITGSAAYEILVATPARGRRADVVEVQTLKQAMVSGVCQFFDEAIELNVASSSQDAMAPLSDYVSPSGDAAADANIVSIRSALDAVIAQPNMVVYGGRASGNNTIGAEVGVIDRANNQILVFGASNCGSDN